MVIPYPHPNPSIQNRPLSLLLLLLVLLIPLLVQYPLAKLDAESNSMPAPSESVTTPDFGKLPLSFVPNAGQSDPNIQMEVRGLGGMLFFSANEIVLSLPASAGNPAVVRARHAAPVPPDAPASICRGEACRAPTPIVQPILVRLQFDGANPVPKVTGTQQLPGIVNYFIGNDPAQWRTNLPTYAGIVYQELYPGIDLHYDGTAGQLKGTYTIVPGGDPSLIRWRYAGASGVQMDDGGNLVISLAGGRRQTLTEQAPIAWQDIDGQRISVVARYSLANDGSISFALGHYDHHYPLTIDPILSYSTYLGGSGADYGSGIVVDSAGNAYITGSTSSPNFPTKQALQSSNGGASDAFVAKLNAAGNALVYSTYLGGSQMDGGTDIAIDNAGNVYVTGSTGSLNFPAQNALQPSCLRNSLGNCFSAFVTKLNAAGNDLVYSTYLGGSDRDTALGIAVNSAGNAYVTGRTNSVDFPIANPLQSTFGGGTEDVFVAKLNTTGNGLVYSTYLGGSERDDGTAIAVDNVGNAYVTGFTSSPNFPTKHALQLAFHGEPCDHCFDAFVAKLNAAGNDLVYSTYLGGDNHDSGEGMAVDSIGNAYVTGSTVSSDFPFTSRLQSTMNMSSGPTCPILDEPCADAFIMKLNASGSALVYSASLGGRGSDGGSDIAIDSAGNAYLTGATGSKDFPTVNAIQPTLGGDRSDAFVAKLNAAGSGLIYSTYLGGSSEDAGFGIAVDSAGNAYVTGETTSSDFPTRNALQPTFGQIGTCNTRCPDAFVAKIGKLVGQVHLPLIQK